MAAKKKNDNNPGKDRSSGRSPGAGTAQNSMRAYERQLLKQFGGKGGYVSFSPMSAAAAVATLTKSVKASEMYKDATNSRMLLAAARKLAEEGHQRSAEDDMKRQAIASKARQTRAGRTSRK